MNKKRILIIIVAIIVILMLMLTINKNVNKNNSNNNNNDNVDDTVRSVVYKHTEFIIPKGIIYMTDEFSIHLAVEDKFEAVIEPLLDYDKLMRDNSSQVVKDLETKGIKVKDGPFDANYKDTSYFYYNIIDDETDKLVAYMYGEDPYVFEIIYKSYENNNDSLNDIFDIIKNIRYKMNLEYTYQFHKFVID